MSNISSDDNQSLQLVSPESFRNVISHFTSGVSIITVRESEIDYGITASAVSSVSLEPQCYLYVPIKIQVPAMLFRKQVHLL
ncbi:hypothetical protein Q5O89_15915 [Peribacillus frigoritolerans]|nr:hypothetical protein [Peribacillus frigoritolerans]